MKIDKEFIEICVKVYTFFNDYEKVAFWLNTENPNFGSKPINMIIRGRGHKLLSFIKNALGENKRSLK